MSTPIYLELDGIRYRVYDTRIVRPHVTKYADPPTRWATSRIFRPRDGWWRIHQFTPGESRAIDEATLLRQLRGAGYLERTRFDAASLGPAHGTGS